MKRDHQHTFIVTCTEMHEIEYRIRAKSKGDVLNKMTNGDFSPITRNKLLDRTLSIRQERPKFDKRTTHYIT